MKKLLYCAAALATLLFAGSCQRENLEPAVEGATVTYTVKVPEAIATKAIGDEITAVDKVYFEVYRAGEVEDLTKAPVYQGDKPVTNNVASFDLEFVKGQNFVVLFWAQNSALVNTDVNSATGMYNINDLRAIRLVNPGASNNAAAQVFAGKDTVKDCVSDAKGNVTLTRPVSQINVYTTTESLNFGEVIIGLDKSSMTVAGLYNTFNVETGDAVVSDENKATFVYTEAAVPAVSADKADLKYVAMNYVGFAPQAGTTTTVDFTIKTTTEVKPIEHTVSNVPVKPNYRTNIVGNLITEAADYNVTLDADWADEEYTEVVVSTASDLQTEVNNILDGETAEITLGGDIDFTGLIGTLTKASDAPASLIIPAEKTVVLNLNGYTLSQTVDYAGHSMIVNNGALTLKGEGTVRYTYKGTPDSTYGKGNQAISNFGTLILDGPTVENATEKMSHAVFAIDTREGATFNVVDGSVLCANATAVRMGQFGADANEMTVEGGRIYGNRAVQVHLPSPSATVNPVMTLNVQGGVLESNDETYNIGVYVISNGQSAENVTVQIGGEAEIKGSVLVNADATDTMNDAAIQISGGTIDGIYGVYSYSTDAAKADAVISVTGGTFAATPNYVDPAYEAKKQDGKYVVVAKPTVAKIGEAEYWSLNAAVAAVQDGETITLVANEMFTATNYFDNGGWRDGLGYAGDKSFTIDLNEKTIAQNGALNDYLIWIKNAGAKENTITLKNGTLDAGKTAFCALCTANSHDNKLTVNLENITLINENSSGSTVKIRAGSELNVKAGTKIIGKDSYLGIENWKAVVNIYDGAEIYMNGTSSYNGCLVGVGGNGTVNVYGGYGKGVSGGLIAMTSGGTINAKGGEWIANTDGTYSNSNKSVLVAQSDKQYNVGAGNAVVNVTGGTYKGGYNCYGNAVGDAQINISGGNFNSDPTAYLAEACEANENAGVWTVRVLPAAKIGETEYASLKEAFNVGGNITLLRNVTLDETVVLAEGKTVVLNLNGKTLAHADEANKYAIDNSGTLTITGNGIVNARGIYNGYNNGTPVASAKLTIENGTFNAKGTNGGACVFNYGTAEIKGGSFTSIGGYSLNNQEGSFMSIADGVTANNGIYTSNATLTVNGGTIQGNRSGCHVLYSWNSSVEINGGNFYNYNSGNATLMAAGTSTMIVNDGTFGIKDGRIPGNGNTWTSCLTDTQNSASMTVNGGTFNGGFRVQAGTTMTITSGSFNDCYGSNYNIYGTARVKGGTYTDATAQNFAKKYIAEGYEMNANGEVVAK